MCGIYASICKNAIKECCEGLEKLQYRGYDSCGVAFFCKNKADCSVMLKDNLQIIKEQGKIENLKKTIKNSGVENYNIEVCIGHTRWATHGKPTKQNAHPHHSQSKEFAVVHNGIVENFEELKKMLPNVCFYSQTDTEVICNLLQQNQKESTLSKIVEVCKMLQGTYALCILDSKEKNTVYCVCNQSPLVVSKTTKGVFACSDVECINCNKSVFYLPNKTICKLSKNSVEFFNFDKTKIDVETTKVKKEKEQVQVKQFDFFMQKEIAECAETMERTKVQFEKDIKKVCKKQLMDCNHIMFIGCGTAFNAGECANLFLQETSNITSSTHIASEFVYLKNNHTKKTIAVFISQSGETMDTIKAAKKCYGQNIFCIAITNKPNCTLSKICNATLFLNAGAERSVASTKAYDAMLVSLFLFCGFVACLKNTKRKETNQNLFTMKNIKQNIDCCIKTIKGRNIDKECKIMAKQILQNKKIFIVGKGMDYAVAAEGALKIKEITYLQTQAMYAGELKHGTISLLDKDSIVICIATNKNSMLKMENVMQEIESRNATVLKIECEVFKNDTINHLFMPLVCVEYFQKIAYYMCLQLKQNPDMPRALAKSVTVE